MCLTLFHPYVIGPKGVLCVEVGWKAWLTDNSAVRYGLCVPCQKRAIPYFRGGLQRNDLTYHHLQRTALGSVSCRKPHQHVIITLEDSLMSS